MTEAAREQDAFSDGVRSRAPSRGTTFTAAATGWRIVDALLAVTIITALVIASNLERMPHGLEEFLSIRLSLKNGVLLPAFGIAWPVVLSVCGVYSPARMREGRGEWPRLLLAAAIGCLLAMVFPLTSRSRAVQPRHALFFGLAIAPASAILRRSVRGVQRARRGTRPRQIVIVGSGPMAARIHGELQADPLRGSQVIGFVDSEPHPALGFSDSVHLGGVAELEWILMHRVVDDVFIGLPIKSRYEEIEHTLAACQRVGVPAKYGADLFQRGLSISRRDGGGAVPMLALLVGPDDSRRRIKRSIDVIGASVLLLLCSPLMILAALAVKLTSRGPVFFSQERYGFMKRRFRMHKFRTMVVNAEQLQAELEARNEAAGPIFKIQSDPRFTRVGRLLRRTSIDELPQLWNVLTGAMSLVGPRPMSLRDVRLFAEPWLMKRFSAPPGLTCLWQISGRSSLTFEQWIALDLEYIDNWSLLLDSTILLRTIPAVLSGRGAV